MGDFNFKLVTVISIYRKVQVFRVKRIANCLCLPLIWTVDYTSRQAFVYYCKIDRGLERQYQVLV